MSTLAQHGRLTRRDFFHDVAEATRARLPDDLGVCQIMSTHNLLKLHFGYPRLHYEVWANARDGHIEIGLHFEDGPDSTERLIAYFDRHILEIKHLLGAETELERWTHSWGHLYQLLPYQPLTDDLAIEVADRLAGMIRCLQPLLVEAMSGLRSRRAT